MAKKPEPLTLEQKAFMALPAEDKIARYFSVKQAFEEADDLDHEFTPMICDDAEDNELQGPCAAFAAAAREDLNDIVKLLKRSRSKIVRQFLKWEEQELKYLPS